MEKINNKVDTNAEEEITYDEHTCASKSESAIDVASIEAEKKYYDTVIHPPHYIRGDYECVEIIKAITEDLSGPEVYFVGNILKYIWRYPEKNGIEDLDKAAMYIRMLKDYIMYERDA